MPKTQAKSKAQKFDLAGILEDSAVEVDEAVQLRWMRIGDAIAHQAAGNPKLHNIEALARTFLRDGFTDPPKWDANLNDGQGGFVFGNGRLEALAWLEDKFRKGEAIEVKGEVVEVFKPRGIGTEVGTGAWVVPVKFGVDSSGFTHAQQQLIDHNSLNLLGGDYDVLEVARMYDQDAYLAMLGSIKESAEEEGIDLGGELTYTVTGEDFSLLTQIAGQIGSPLEFQEPELNLGGEVSGGFSEGTGEDEDDEDEESDLPPEAGVRMLQLFLDTETHPEMIRMVEALNPILHTKNPTDCILEAMRQLYATHFGQSGKDK